jgi:hypothetical protein
VVEEIAIKFSFSMVSRIFEFLCRLRRPIENMDSAASLYETFGYRESKALASTSHNEDFPANIELVMSSITHDVPLLARCLPVYAIWL